MGLSNGRSSIIPGSVLILAQPTPDTLLMVRQYRYPVATWTLEIPAGTLVPDEDPRACATRELAEEAGVRPLRLVERMRFWPAVGLSDEEMILYQAYGLEPAEAKLTMVNSFDPTLYRSPNWQNIAAMVSSAMPKPLLRSRV